MDEVDQIPEVNYMPNGAQRELKVLEAELGAALRVRGLLTQMQRGARVELNFTLEHDGKYWRVIDAEHRCRAGI